MSLGSISPQSEAEIRNTAKSMGLIAILPKDNELLLDIDEPYAVAVVKWQSSVKNKELMDLVSNVGNVNITSTLHTKSKGGNLHVYIKLDQDLEPCEHMLLQALLGSDPKREIYNMLRTKFAREANSKSYNMALFETATEAASVVVWRAKCNVSYLRKRITRTR